MSEAGEVDVNQPVVDLVHHLGSALKSVSFKTFPFQSNNKKIKKG